MTRSVKTFTYIHIYYEIRRNISLRFSSNSEADASELIDETFPSILHGQY